MSYKILNISKFSNSHSIFSSPSVSPASHAASRSVYVLRIHSQPKRALPHYTLKAKYSLINHYSLNFARPLLPFHIVPLKNRSETIFAPLRKSQILNLQSKIRRQPPKVHLLSIIYAVYRTWFIYHLSSIIYAAGRGPTSN